MSRYSTALTRNMRRTYWSNRHAVTLHQLGMLALCIVCLLGVAWVEAH